jgi:hypothetical protein
VNDYCSRKRSRGCAARAVVSGSLAVVAMLALSGFARAQETSPGAKSQDKREEIARPTTPPAITPPAGNSVFLVGHATGTQGYVCLPGSAGVSWTINNARPEATLFANTSGADVQIMTHFLSPNTNPNQFAPNPLPFGSPTWQSSVDSSKVWAQPGRAIAAGSDPSCPNTGSIPCLALQVIGSAQGPAGGKLLTETTFVQRLNTRGGSAPAAGCVAQADVGKQALVPYTADYFFFRADR